MKFVSGSNAVYVVFPVTATVPANTQYNSAYLDLRVENSKAPANSIYNFDVASSEMSAFNLFAGTDYNIFYTATVGSNTILISSFILIVNSLATTDTSAGFSELMTLDWDAAIPTTGDKLCYAATSSTGNVDH